MEDSGGNIGPMCICIKDHGRNVCERLQQLRLSTGLVDLDIVVEEERLRVHKVVLAAASKFFKDQLTKANVLVPVILRLEDFGLDLKREAVCYIVEFIYCGEVLIPGECLSDVCVAAHTLGVYGLIEFLPNAVPLQKEVNTLTSSASPMASTSSSSTASTSSSVSLSTYPPVVSLEHTNYLEPSFSSVDPVLDDALSLLARGAFPLDEVPHGKLRVLSEEKIAQRDNKAERPKSQTPSSQDKNTGDPSPLISVSTPQPAEWSSDPSSAGWADDDWGLTGDRGECKQTEGAWTTPAESTLSPSKEIASWGEPRSRSDETSIVMWNPTKTNNAPGNHGFRKKASSSPSAQKSGEGNWKGDLEVRKDLTLPSAPSDGGDNVFQEEEPAAITTYPIVHLDDGDLEVVESNSSNGGGPLSDSGLADPSSSDLGDVVLPFSNTSQLRSHLKIPPPQTESLLTCPVCQISGLRGKEAVNIHVYKEHGMGELFRCEECSYETSIKTTYIRHMAEHANTSDSPGKTKMKCSKCVKEFRSKIGLKLHLKQHYIDQLNLCLFCEFKTPQKINLIKHMASKHKKGIDGKDLSSDFKCQFCLFECVAEHQLKAHLLRKHTAKEEMKFQCVSCTYATVERAALEKHVRFKHTKERPFMCAICGFSTHTLSSMARHKQAHLKTKPYSCKMCGASYADKKRLSEHILSHSGEKPFACDLCSYKCRRKDNLAAHVKRVHSSHVKGLVDSVPKASTGPGMVVSNRESHIVGHVNQDGSIRPVVANPKPQMNATPILDPASSGLEFQYNSQPAAEDVKIRGRKHPET